LSEYPRLSLRTSSRAKDPMHAHAAHCNTRDKDFN